MPVLELEIEYVRLIQMRNCQTKEETHSTETKLIYLIIAFMSHLKNGQWAKYLCEWEKKRNY